MLPDISALPQVANVTCRCRVSPVVEERYVKLLNVTYRSKMLLEVPGICLIYGNCIRIGIYLCFNRYKFMHVHIFMHMHIFMHIHIFMHTHIFMHKT